MKEYFLYIDDTGFNANQKNSSILQDELGTFVGVLIPKELLQWLAEQMKEFSQFLNARYKTSEFHFTDIYNRRPPFEKIDISETQDILTLFSTVFQELELKIFVHTNTKEFEKENKIFLDSINIIAKKLHMPEDSKTQELFITYFKAKKYVEESLRDGKITEIVCDEGIRKKGAIEKIDSNTTLKFESSKDCCFLQLADFAAWFVTRAKHIVDKASTNKTLSDVDKSIIEIYSSLSENFVGLPKYSICPDILDDFDYDKIHKNLINKK